MSTSTTFTLDQASGYLDAVLGVEDNGALSLRHNGELLLELRLEAAHSHLLAVHKYHVRWLCARAKAVAVDGSLSLSRSVVASSSGKRRRSTLLHAR